MNVKGIADDIGCIRSFVDICPKEFYSQFLESLAELEDNDNHVRRTYPISRFHKMEGTSDYQIFRFDIDKMSGWRCMAQFNKNDGRLHLCGISEPKYHNKPLEFVTAHKDYFVK